MALINKWEFSKDSKCFNCQKTAAQRIEMVPSETVVTCTNCGAERHYTIHASFEGKEKPDLSADGKKRKYDLWKFDREDICANCLNISKNEVTVDEYRIAAFCPICLYTRIYNFNMLTRPGH